MEDNFNNTNGFKLEEWHVSSGPYQKKSWGEKLIDFIIKYSGGLIKKREGALYFIIIFSLVVIFISVYLIISPLLSQPVKSPFPPNYKP